MLGRGAVTLFCVVTMAGCAHRFYTAEFAGADSWQVHSKNKVQGVIFYEPDYVKITHSFMTLIAADGKVLGRAPDGCMAAVQKEEIALMANLSKRRVLLNEPGPLASGQLKVTLTNGMLGGLESTSTSQLPDFIEKGGALAMTSAPNPTPGRETACNAGPQITSFVPVQLQSLPADPRALE